MTQEIYLLLIDIDGTLRSHDEPFGVAVTTEAEADKFVDEGGVGYSHSYRKIKVFDTKDEAIKDAYPNYKGNK
jgi:hypothetical protein